MSSTTATLTEFSRAGGLLWKIFHVGDIGPEDTPETVWERHYNFKGHKLNIFRAKYNKIKLEKNKGFDGKFIRNVFYGFPFHQ